MQHPLLRYLLRRLGQSALMLAGLLVIVFGLLRLSGDPTNLLAPRDATPEQRAEIRAAYGFDRPVAVQFGDFVVDAVRLDFGDSIRYKQPVRAVITDRMPATLELGVVAVVLAMVIGIPLGVLAGVHPQRGVDGTTRGVALLGQTIPDFWLALVLILVFAVNLRWFAPFGRETFHLGPLELPNHSILLPALALCLFPMAQLLRFTRSSVLEIVGEDYVRIARSKGIPARLIYRRHILRNAMIPLISVLSLQVGALLSGSLYIEAVFSWPGAGGLMAEAVGNRDFPLVQGLAFLGGLITILFSLLVDVLYQLADPRIRLRGRAMTAEIVDVGPARTWRTWRVRCCARPAASPGSRSSGCSSCSPCSLRSSHRTTRSRKSLRDANMPPFWSSEGSTRFLLGTDSLGRDILSRLIYGTRVSLTVAVGGVVIATTLGVALGLIAGYRGGRIDRIIVWANDLLLSVPYTLLVVVIAAVVGKSLLNVILIFGFTDIPIFVHVARGEVLKLSESTFVEAARSVGVPRRRILWAHLVPNLIGPVGTLATFEMSAMILYEAGLGFLGLSVPPSTPSWGNMINAGRGALEVYPWMSIAPGVAIVLAGLGLNLLGDFSRDALDPRTRRVRR